MDPVTISVGLIVSTFAKNKEVHDMVDGFVSDSVHWIKGWITDSGKNKLVDRLVDKPEHPKTESKLADVIQHLSKDDKFKGELERWIKENQKPEPSMKNVLEDADIDVAGDITIGDKEGASQGHYDTKNVIKRSKIKGGGDFSLGDQ